MEEKKRPSPDFKIVCDDPRTLLDGLAYRGAITDSVINKKLWISKNGGAELALACDFRIASEKARFIFTEVKLGIIPDGGGIPRLTRLVGYGKAKEIILTGKTIEGKEAESIGLVNKCVAPEQLMAEAKELADRLINCSPMALGVAKRMIDQAMDFDLMSALDMVGFAQSELLNSEDFQEGIQAFIDKRKPVFKGK